MGKKQEKFNDYEGFVEKFKPKKTTDDCYTPEAVYNVVAEFVAEEYGVSRESFVRPFYPGRDYTEYDYRQGDIVVDNPPFSILTHIIRWYNDNGIKYFLFAPALTGIKPECCAVFANASIIYENGARVRTSFLTNLYEEHAAVTSPKLAKRLKEAQRNRQNNAKCALPANILTGARLDLIARDTEIKIDRTACAYVRKLDNQKRYGSRSIYGGGYLVPDSVKSLYEDKLPIHDDLPVCELSAREHDIIKALEVR